MTVQNELGKISILEILTQNEEGRSASFLQLCALLSEPNSIPEDIFLSILLQLRQCIGSLTQQTKSLVLKILNIDWIVINDNVLKELGQFLVSLAVGQIFYLELVLRCVVKKFIPYLPSVGDDAVADLDVLDAKFDLVFARIYGQAHDVINCILRISPMCQDKLKEILAGSFPYMRRHVMLIRDYTRNLLCLSAHASAIRVDILRSVVEELLRIDTVCNKEVAKLWEENDEAATSNDIFSMECDSEEAKKNYLKLCELKMKLDVEMCDIFFYIETRYQDAEDALNKQGNVYDDFFTVFERIVLPVFSCSYVQYVWFYLCSLKSEWNAQFLNYLWQKVQDPNMSPLLRQSAACYLSGFLSRATYINLQQCKNYLDLCVYWLHQYVNNEDLIKKRDGASLHGTFYAVFQSTLYVITFRHKELLELKKGHDYLKNLNLDRLITCSLNPLKYCLESVVTNFASIGRNYQFAFCYTVIERNRRTAMYDKFRLSFDATDSSTNCVQRLDCFFPFDPYVLPKYIHIRAHTVELDGVLYTMSQNLLSLSFISPLYRHYDESEYTSPPSVVRSKEKRKSKQAEIEKLEEEEDDFLMDDIIISQTNSVESYKTKNPLISYAISPGFKSGLS